MIISSDAANSYQHLEALLLREGNTLSEENADSISDCMDSLWRLMTQKERDAANLRVQVAKLVKAPKSLNLRDVPVEEGESHLPREEA